MQPPDLDFHVGTYTAASSGGIHHIRLSGTFPEPVESRLVAEARSPSWITILPASRILLGVEEVGATDHPRLLSFRIGEQGRLTPMAAADLPGSHPCHIGVHPTAPLAVTAHYSDGSAVLWHIAPETGVLTLLQHVQLFGQGSNTSRQESSHAHFAAFIEDGDCLAVTDLGGDAVHFFDLENDVNLIPRQRLALPPGSGPRHLADGRDRLYLSCELDETIYTLEQEDGLYRIRDRIMPFDGDSRRDGALSAIKLSPDGRFLYVAGRNQSAIARLAVMPDGGLRLEGKTGCGGDHPRDLTIDPSGQWLIVANQRSHTLCLFRLDRISGRPERIPGAVEISAPACILFTPPDSLGAQT